MFLPVYRFVDPEPENLFDEMLGVGSVDRSCIAYGLIRHGCVGDLRNCKHELGKNGLRAPFYPLRNFFLTHFPYIGKMFKKPFSQLRSFSSVRSSDRRRLRDEILAEFPAFGATSMTEQHGELAPEGLQAAKFVSHGGESGMVYTNADGMPLWVRVEIDGKREGQLMPSRKPWQQRFLL